MPDVTENNKLEDAACQCGEGYFQPDGAWVSGVDVRSGNAQPKISGNGQPPPKDSAKGQKQIRIPSFYSSKS